MFVNVVYHSYRILFIAVSIKNIVDMSGNKQFVKTRAYVIPYNRRSMLFASALWRVWRAYQQLRRSRSGEEIRPSCAKFSTTPSSFARFR